jgi:hypothetical protein
LKDEDKLRGFIGKFGRISSVTKSKGGPGGDDWIVTMHTTEEAIIMRGHLHSRTVNGVYFLIDYVLPKVKNESAST